MIGPLEFFIVAAVLYLMECFRVTHPQALLLRRLRSGKFSTRHPVHYPGNGKWGWVLLNPILPGAETLATQPPPNRFHSLQSFDPSAIRARILQTRTATAGLRRNAILGFGLWFLLLPLAVYFLTLSNALLAAIPFVLGLALWTMREFNQAARTLHANMPTEDRYGNLAKFLLYPISILRAADSLTLTALDAFDPIAVIHVTQGPAPARALAERQWSTLRLQPSRAQEFLSLNAALDSLNLTIHSIPPPIPDGPASIAYCPSCRAQFATAQTHCPDCPNIPLEPLIPHQTENI
jgi:hypothetical protein